MSSTNDEGFAKPWQEFKKEFGSAPMLHGPLDNIFKGWEQLLTNMVAKYEFPAPDTSVKTEDVQVNDHLKCRVYTPPSATGNNQLGVYFHGGGWVMGDLEIEDAQCRVISKQCGLILVSVEYRLAPAHKFPTPLDDCVEAAKWAMKSRSKLGAGDGPVAMIGTSAGGGLAFGTALRLIDEGLADQLAGVVGLVPVTVHPAAVPADMKDRYTSYDDHAEHTVNTKDAMAAFLDEYGAPPDDKYTSCLLHPALDKIPKAYIVECGMDTLRDDARLMKEKLDGLGVPVKYDDFPGYPHYSWTLPSKLLAGHQAEFFGKLVQGVNWVYK